MELTIQKDILARSIQTVQNAITQKSSLPILSNILLEADTNAIKLTATDLDIGICSVSPLLAGQEGAITIPAKKFFDIVKSLPEGTDLSLSVKKNNIISIKGGKAQFKIVGLPKEDFPNLPLFEDKESIVMEQKVLKELINFSDFAISKDDSRHVLTGVLFSVKGKSVSMVATDGRRMAAVKKEIKVSKEIERESIIPSKTVQEVKRQLKDEGEVKIQFSNNQIMFSFEDSFIISRLIEGEFPDYNKVIPAESENKVKVNKNELLDATRRVSIFTDQESQAVKLLIQKTKMTLSKTTPYLGEAKEEVKIEYTGENEMSIGFNPKYIIDVLKNIKEEEIEMEVNDYNKPGVIRKGEEYIYVVLPMQLAE
jgi:DNA polymerase III subunit beta